MSTATVEKIDTGKPGVPLTRIVKVELRKMFDTRAGFWLMMSIGIIAAVATLIVILVVDGEDLEFGHFAGAVGFPMAVILPIIAILSVTSEWGQRTGLITFTLVPHRGQLILGKAIAAILVGIVSVLLALVIGALGNLLGSAIAGVDPTWDIGVSDMLLIILGNVLGLLIGFMLGVLFRNTPAAIVAYFVYSLVLPGLFELLANFQDWFKDVRPWIDFNFAQTPLFDGGFKNGEQYAQLGTSGLIWFILPMAFGVWAILKSEVK